jgi:hypothetical protein
VANDRAIYQWRDSDVSYMLEFTSRYVPTTSLPLSVNEDYDLTRGGFLELGLLFVAVSPLLAARISGQRPHPPPHHR